MTHVVTLVANPNEPALNDEIVHRVQQSLPAAQSAAWLAEAIAADIFFEHPSAGTHELCVLLRQALNGLPIDFIIQPAAARRKTLLIADMDSTMIGQECIDELADFAGQKSYVAAITERAMRGELAFEPALRERVALLRGLSTDVVQQVIGQRITLTPGARTLIQTMRANGAYTVLVSGGFTVFAKEIAEMIGFDTYRANVLIVENNTFAGRVDEPILGKAAKLESLKYFCAKKNISFDETLAVGDGANDLAMIEQAGLGVAFRAKPAVATAADAQIDHCDLTALLYAQGYKYTEFQD